MRFLADQDVYAVTCRFLSNLGHDVVTASQIGLSDADDEELLREAHRQHRLFVTRDRDFGGIVFVRGVRAGILYLRMSPLTQDLVHDELERILTLYREDALHGSFVVVESSRHRIRRLSSVHE